MKIGNKKSLFSYNSRVRIYTFYEDVKESFT